MKSLKDAENVAEEERDGRSQGGHEYGQRGRTSDGRRGRTHDCTDAFERAGGFPKSCDRAYGLDFGRVSEPSGGLKNLKGQMSAARDSAESDRPARRRPASGSEDRLSMLQREDAEEFGPPTVRSFEEDALLKRPPPEFCLGQEYWLGLQVYTREKLWRMYHLDNPSTMDDDELSRMVEAVRRGRKKRAEKKAREVFEDLQTRLDEAARQLWGDERSRQGAEERIADAEARMKELKAEEAAAGSNQRETYDQYHKLCQEWRAEERKSRQKISGTLHQDLVLEPLKLPDLHPSVLHFRDSKLAEPQRVLAAPPPTMRRPREQRCQLG